MSNVVQVPETFEAARAGLAPRVYGTAQAAIDYLDLLNTGATAGHSVLHPVTEDLSVGVVVATPTGFAKVSADILAGWGISFSEVLDAAVLQTRSEDLDVSQIGAGTFVIRGANYAGAVWLSPVSASSLPVFGAPLVWAVSSDMTIVSGADDPQGMMIAAATIEQVLAQGIRVESVTPQLWTGQAWVSQEWAATPEDTANMVEHRFTASLYARQAPVLERYYTAQGLNVHIAEYALVRNREGRAIGVASWSEGVVSALPAADEVVLVSASGIAVGVAWDRLIAECSELVQPANTVPPRYFPRGFPTPAQITLLTAQAPNTDNFGASGGNA